jgi:opacity protein-like surface antigen
MRNIVTSTWTMDIQYEYMDEEHSDEYMDDTITINTSTWTRNIVTSTWTIQ